MPNSPGNDQRRRAPTLDEIAANPHAAAGLPLTTLAVLQTKCAAALGALAAAALGHEAEKSDRAGEDALLTVSEVARRLALAHSYVYELARTKQIPAVRVGRYVRVKLSEVERFIARHDSIRGLDNVLNERLQKSV